MPANRNYYPYNNPKLYHQQQQYKLAMPYAAAQQWLTPPNTTSNSSPMAVAQSTTAAASAKPSSFVLHFTIPPGRLGVVLRAQDEPTQTNIVVEKVTPGSPMELKILPGDIFLEVNGCDVRPWKLDEFAAFFKKTNSQQRYVKILREPPKPAVTQPTAAASSSSAVSPPKQPVTTTNGKGSPKTAVQKKVDPPPKATAAAAPPKETPLASIQRYVMTKNLYSDMLYNFSQYCLGTEEQGETLLLEYLAKKSSAAYLKHTKLAQEEAKKEQNGTKPSSSSTTKLPGNDYVNHDGRYDDPDWNIYYSKLKEYKQEHGDCLVPVTEVPLGIFVSMQRHGYKNVVPSMTPKRIELLDDLEFEWTADPSHPGYIPGGCQELNKALAAKLVYPQLSPREALCLGGYTDDELDVVVDEEHSWRTKYTVLKNKLDCRETGWYNLPQKKKGPTSKKVKELVNMLKGDEGYRFEMVFGDQSDLLEGFLKAADERMKANAGGGGKPKAKRKRSYNPARKTSDDDETEDEDSPVRRKQSRSAKVTDEEQEEADIFAEIARRAAALF